MISFTYAQLSGYLAAFLWPLARIAALMAAAPVFGNLGVPRRLKILLAVAVTAVLMPVVGPMQDLEPWSAPGLLLLAQQMIIGIALGLTMRMVFTMVDVAGELAGMQMGLGFATFFDPQHASSLPVVAQFLGLLTTLTFFSANGHLMLLSVLAESFRLLPMADTGLSASVWLTLVDWGGKIFLTGLMLSLPIVAALLVTNLALGVLTRAAPQLNVFSVGFPVTLLVGWAVLLLSLPYFAPALVRLFDDGFQMMAQIMAQAAPR